jgi:hypothetical protein
MARCGSWGAGTWNFIHWWESKMVPLLWRPVRQFLKMLSMCLASCPAISLLCTYQKGVKGDVQTKTSAWIFIALLFVIAQIWKQLKCPKTGEQRNKLYSVYTMIEYAATQNACFHTCKNMTLKIIMLWKKADKKCA